MNKNQKIILAIFIPVLLFLIALTIAYYITIEPGELYFDPYGAVFSNWGETWYVWFVFLIFVCIFEYKLFDDKKKKDKELEEG